jgi:hypothetical protein
MRNNYFKSLAAWLMVFILISGCNLFTSDEVVDNRDLVEGLYFTNETSPEILNIFGEPAKLVEVPIRHDSLSQHDPNIPEAFFVSVPYPNPADGSPSFELQVPEATHVKVWIENARWIEDKPKMFDEVKVMEIANGNLQTGYHRFTLNMQEKCRGGIFDEGFYRIKVQAYDTTLFVDMFLLGTRENMPDDMKEMAEGYLGCQ